MAKTYNPKKISISLGNHVASGFADDTFVSIEPSSDAVTMKVGCDGEVVRSISPDNSYNIKLTLLQYSPTHKFLTNKAKQDREEGTGSFPLVVKDIVGNTLFSTDEAWVSKMPTIQYGKESNNREWSIACGDGELTQD